METLIQLLSSHLNFLAGQIGPRPAGSPANRRAAEYAAAGLAAAGLKVEALPFECLDWELRGCSLALDGEPLPGMVNPYTQTCHLEAPFILLDSLAALQAAPLAGKVAVIHGELAKEPLIPKNFPFFQPEEHQALIHALEAAAPLAVAAISSQAANPAPIFDDGDFALPSVTLPAGALAALQANPGGRLRLAIDCTRRPGQGFTPIGHTPAAASGRVVVVCAHLDTKPGTPGALDNAAGSAALLALAARLGPNPPRAFQLEFIAFNGEDHFAQPGQLAYLGKHPARMGAIDLAINLDSPAAAGQRNTLALFECGPALEQTILSAAHGRPDLLQTDPWPQGDHTLFVMAGRPALAVTSEGIWELVETTLHTQADTLAGVDPASLARLVDYLEMLLRQM